MHTLLLTSCNRIKQTALALLINSFLIKEKFNLVIADSSHQNISREEGILFHRTFDTYNYILDYNYCSDINILYNTIQEIRNINRYQIIRVDPKMTKDIGDATLMAIGLSAASLFGNADKCLKMNGACIMYKDIWPLLYQDFDVLHFDYHLGWFSTRIFGCNAQLVSAALINRGHAWIDNTTKFVEEKFTNIVLDSHFKLKYSNLTESNAVSRSGEPRDMERIRIKKLLEEKQINVNNQIMIEFMDGEIW